MLEHAIPEKFFIDASHPNEGVSAVKAIAKAMQAGQKIYTITQTNAATVLTQISHDAVVINDIQTATAAGKEAIVSERIVTVGGLVRDISLSTLIPAQELISLMVGRMEGSCQIAFGDAISLLFQSILFGFDHGVGHSLLLLYDAKISYGENIINFNGLDYDPSTGLSKLIVYHNKTYY